MPLTAAEVKGMIKEANADAVKGFVRALGFEDEEALKAKINADPGAGSEPKPAAGDATALERRMNALEEERKRDTVRHQQALDDAVAVERKKIETAETAHQEALEQVQAENAIRLKLLNPGEGKIGVKPEFLDFALDQYAKAIEGKPESEQDAFTPDKWLDGVPDTQKVILATGNGEGVDKGILPEVKARDEKAAKWTGLDEAARQALIVSNATEAQSLKEAFEAKQTADRQANDQKLTGLETAEKTAREAATAAATALEEARKAATTGNLPVDGNPPGGIVTGPKNLRDAPREERNKRLQDLGIPAA